MKVLLLKDVFTLGRAGDVKKVADGYGRNFLLPQKLAVLATPGAMKQAEHIKKVAAEQRAALNQEMSVVAERLEGVELAFPVKAGETGRLYGSVTTAMIVDAIKDQTGTEIDRRQIESQPIKLLGVHYARVRLTMDLLPEIKVIVYREGESPESVLEEEIIIEEVPTEDFAELQAELDAMEAEAEAEAVNLVVKAEAEEVTAEAELGDVEEATADIEAEIVERETKAEAVAESDLDADAELAKIEAEAADSESMKTSDLDEKDAEQIETEESE